MIRAFVVFSMLSIGAARASAQERRQSSSDPIAQIQIEGVLTGSSPVAHWGSDPKRYSQWTTHSNRLVPVYTWGTKGAGKGIDVDDYIGANSPYRSAERLHRIYGVEPRDTVN